MAEPITVGVITDAAGAHLDAYLGGLSSCEGVEQVALADPTGGVSPKPALSSQPASPRYRRFATTG